MAKSRPTLPSEIQNDVRWCITRISDLETRTTTASPDGLGKTQVGDLENSIIELVDVLVVVKEKLDGLVGDVDLTSRAVEHHTERLDHLSQC